MLPQDCIIQLFLSNPTKELLLTIDNRDLALELLRDLPDSAPKLYFLWLMDKDTISPPNLIRLAIKENNTEIFNHFRGKFNIKNIKHCAVLAAKYGSRRILYSLIGDYNDDKLEDISCSAARGGYRDIVYDIMRRMDKINPHFYYHIAGHAASGCHKDLYDEFLNIFAAQKVSSYAHDLIWVACCVAYSGDKISLDQLMEEIVKYNSTPEMRDIKLSSAHGGHRELLNYLLDITDGPDQWEDIAVSAALGGNIDIVYDMIEKGDIPLDIIAYRAASGGHMSMIDRMLEMDDEISYDLICSSAAVFGHREIVIKFYDNVTDYEYLLESLLRGGLQDLAHKVIDEHELAYYNKVTKIAIECDLDSVTNRLKGRCDLQEIADYAKEVGRSDLFISILPI